MTIMGKVAYTVIVAFVASILTLVAVNRLAPDENRISLVSTSPVSSATNAPAGVTAPGSTGNSPSATPKATVSEGITMQDVAGHDNASSCWIVVDGIVYDITTYISKHPTQPEVVLAWCGKEATQAWDTKGGTGDSHSNRAEATLDTYAIGKLAP